MIDTATNMLIATVLTGFTPVGVDVGPDAVPVGRQPLFSRTVGEQRLLEDGGYRQLVRQLLARSREAQPHDPPVVGIRPLDQETGRLFHAHWVVLVPDERVAGGLSVKAVTGSVEEALPPTAPGMPIYLDSPGHSIVADRNRLRIVVPGWRIRDLESFNYDAVVAYMVNTTDENRPMLGVYQVYSVLSGDLSLPRTFSLSERDRSR